MTEPNSEEGQGEVWHREPTLTHELGFLVMEDNTPIAIVPRSAIADRIIADHTAALEGRKAEQRIRELEDLVRVAEPIVRMAHHLRLLTENMMGAAEAWMAREEELRYSSLLTSSSEGSTGGQGGRE